MARSTSVCSDGLLQRTGRHRLHWEKAWHIPEISSEDRRHWHQSIHIVYVAFPMVHSSLAIHDESHRRVRSWLMPTSGAQPPDFIQQPRQILACMRNEVLVTHRRAGEFDVARGRSDKT